MTATGVRVRVEGIVQGVGFRPFLHHLARHHELAGWILNRGNAGVDLHLEGDEERVQAFLHDVRTRSPPVARVDHVHVERVPVEGFTSLDIKPSEDGRGPALVLPADIATCDGCLAEMTGKGPGGTSNKYYRYPFVACASCGPRFTTVVDLPYDRDRTTMIDFPLCERGEAPCIVEYRREDDRRFHAQAFACPHCGPHHVLENARGQVLSREDQAFAQAAKAIARGEVIAMKGIGGSHLVIDACNDGAIDALRTRKGNRRNKPFAVMVPSVAVAREHALVSPVEARWLESHRRPIVLLERLGGSTLSPRVAPGLSSAGFLLPYIGFQHLLLDACRSEGINALVCTSGNASGLPMAITSEAMREHLGGTASHFLVHDRRIHQRCDDSVGKVIDGELVLIRRSRGFVPEHVQLPYSIDRGAIVATGPELHATAGIAAGDKLYLTQYIGDAVNLETLDFMEQAIRHFFKLLRIDRREILGVACDAHPLFLTSSLASDMANEAGCRLVPVQHHHAHCASLAVDGRLTVDTPCVFVICDGIGHGSDGNSWGGEIFSGSLLGLQRVAHLAWRRLPGGDACVKHPARVLASILADVMETSELDDLISNKLPPVFPGGEDERAIVLGQLRDGRTLPLASSTGRVLDAFSCLLGTCTEATYEGEPAMRLEGLGMLVDDAAISDLVVRYKAAFVVRERNGTEELDVAGGFLLAIKDMEHPARSADRPLHARAFQAALGALLGERASIHAAARGIPRVAFGGGVAVNRIIHAWLRREVEHRGFQLVRHVSLPPGDGGIAAGQATMAWLVLR